ncbi:MAG: hypothetical protein ABI391_05835 [Hyphomicrobiaceae bacterium]
MTAFIVLFDTLPTFLGAAASSGAAAITLSARARAVRGVAAVFFTVRAFFAVRAVDFCFFADIAAFCFFAGVAARFAVRGFARFVLAIVIHL